MRLLTANLKKMVAAAPEGPVRSLIASLARAAGLQEDQFARGAYLEGVLGYSPKAITRRPQAFFKEVREALLDKTPNKAVEILRYEKGMSDRDILNMVGNKDMGIFDALVQGAAKAMVGQSSVRGLTPEDIAMAIAAGISPVTGEPFRYGPGKGVFQWLGEKSPNHISMAGIAKIVRMEAKNRALDVVRGTRKEEKFEFPLDLPVGDSAAPTSLSEILSGESAVSRADFVDLAAAIYQDPWVMNLIDSKVRSKLRGPVQVAVWEVIKKDPSLIRVDSNKIGVEARPLAKALARATGTEYKEQSSPMAAGKVFRKKVLPVMMNLFEDPAVAQRLIKNREILELVEDATRRKDQHHKENIKDIRYKGDPREPDPRFGPYGLPPETRGVPRPQKKQPQPWMKKIRERGRNMGLLASAKNVAERYASEQDSIERARRRNE